MRNEFTALIEREKDWYIAYCPEIPGANGQGRPHWPSLCRWKWKAWVAAWPAPRWALPSLAGYLGGVLAPVVGMWLVGLTPVAGFYFWGGCYMLSAVLFLLLKETGPYIRTAG